MLSLLLVELRQKLTSVYPSQYGPCLQGIEALVERLAELSHLVANLIILQYKYWLTDISFNDKVLIAAIKNKESANVIRMNGLPIL